MRCLFDMFVLFGQSYKSKFHKLEALSSKNWDGPENM